MGPVADDVDFLAFVEKDLGKPLTDNQRKLVLWFAYLMGESFENPPPARLHVVSGRGAGRTWLINLWKRYKGIPDEPNIPAGPVGLRLLSDEDT